MISRHAHRVSSARGLERAHGVGLKIVTQRLLNEARRAHRVRAYPRSVCLTSSAIGILNRDEGSGHVGELPGNSAEPIVAQVPVAPGAPSPKLPKNPLELLGFIWEQIQTVRRPAVRRLLYLVAILGLLFYWATTQCDLLAAVESLRPAPHLNAAEIANRIPAPDSLHGGAANHGSLREQLEFSNKLFFARVDSARQASGRSMTILYGPAGVGKSTIINLLGKDACVVRTRSLVSAGALRGKVVRRPDLTISSRIVNELLDWNDPPPTYPISAVLDAGRCDEGSVVAVIDDLDEVHPKLAQSVVRDAARLVGDQLERPMLRHIVLAGRAEAFIDELRDPSTVYRGSFPFAILAAKEPIVISTGDAKLAEQEWAARMVQESSAARADSFIRILQHSTVARRSLGSLAVRNYLFEHLTMASGSSDVDLADGLFGDILERNAQTHGRPPGGASEYLKLVEDIAFRYGKSLDSTGYFVVKFSDSQRVGDGSEIPVRDILNRSGLVDIDPLVFQTLRYRFYPTWLHGYLVGRANVRYAEERDARRLCTEPDRKK